ncbi:MAG: hypothetical protein GVY06_04600 [Alphaproteobacteria bacterium]|nr:hypothetical protein [Alphaproteobacteria bacterium]
MPEGNAMECPVKHNEAIALDEAIERLEAGHPAGEMTVDLGHGRFARADGPHGDKGLLQRLRGHRLLMAMAEDVAGLPGPGDDAASMSDEVSELLDAVKKAR